MKSIHDKPYHKKVYKKATKNLRILIGHGSKPPKHAKKGGPYKINPSKRRPVNKLSAPPGVGGLEEGRLLVENQTDVQKLKTLISQAQPGDWVKIIPLQEIDPDGPGMFCKGWDKAGGYKVEITGPPGEAEVTYQGHLAVCKIPIADAWVPAISSKDSKANILGKLGTTIAALGGNFRRLVDIDRSMAKMGAEVASLRKWLDKTKSKPTPKVKKTKLRVRSDKPAVSQAPVKVDMPRMSTPPIPTKTGGGPLYINRVIKTINNSVNGVNATAEAAGAIVRSPTLTPDQKGGAVARMVKAHAETALPREFYKKPETKEFIKNYAETMGEVLTAISQQKDLRPDDLQYEKDMAAYSMAIVGTMSAYMMELGYTASSELPTLENLKKALPPEWQKKIAELEARGERVAAKIQKLEAMLEAAGKVAKAVEGGDDPVDTLLDVFGVSHDLTKIPKAAGSRTKFLAFGDKWLNDAFDRKAGNAVISAIKGKGYSIYKPAPPVDVIVDSTTGGRGSAYHDPVYWATEAGRSKLELYVAPKSGPDDDDEDKKIDIEILKEAKKIGLVLIGLGSHESYGIAATTRKWGVGAANLINYIRKDLKLNVPIVWTTADEAIICEGKKGCENLKSAERNAQAALAGVSGLTNITFINNLKAAKTRSSRMQDIEDHLSGDYKKLTDDFKYELIKLSMAAKQYVGPNVKVEVKSGYRPKGVGELGNHPTGKAADIRITGLSAQETYAFLIVSMAKGAIKEGGAGFYANGTRAKNWNRDESYAENENPHYDLAHGDTKWFWFKCKSREKCETDIGAYAPAAVGNLKKRTEKVSKDATPAEITNKKCGGKRGKLKKKKCLKRVWSPGQWQTSGGIASHRVIGGNNPLAFPEDVRGEITKYNEAIDSTWAAKLAETGGDVGDYINNIINRAVEKWEKEHGEKKK